MILSLPVEIQEYIVESACAFPDVTNTLSPQLSSYPEHALPLPDIKLSTRSLFSFALVCKRWNAICTPRLYRCLAIVDTTPVDALLLTLEHSRSTTAVLGRISPLGSLTRHLIIALSDYPAHENETERFEIRVERRFGNLGRLARCLPSLHILSISIFIREMWGLPVPHYGKNFAAIITQTSAHSLRKLYLHCYPMVLFSRPELRKLLEAAPNLVAITGAAVGSHIGCPTALPYLPKLKYLAVNSETGQCNFVGHKDNQTPSLDHVHLRPSRFSNFWVHLLSLQGASLTSVTLDFRLTGESENGFDCLSMLTNVCHNLSYLEICVDSWRSFPRLDPLPPVEHLGISVQVGNIPVLVICETLATVQSSSLKVVHLKDTHMFEWFESPLSDNVESAWSPLVDHTFRVVDCHGRELGPPGRSSCVHGHGRVDPRPFPAITRLPIEN
jgi:hypothetical protein